VAKASVSRLREPEFKSCVAVSNLQQVQPVCIAPVHTGVRMNEWVPGYKYWQFTQLYEWIPGYKHWWACWIVCKFSVRYMQKSWETWGH